MILFLQNVKARALFIKNNNSDDLISVYQIQKPKPASFFGKQPITLGDIWGGHPVTGRQPVPPQAPRVDMFLVIIMILCEYLPNMTTLRIKLICVQHCIQNTTQNV